MPFGQQAGFDKLSLTARTECQAELVEASLKRNNVAECESVLLTPV